MSKTASSHCQILNTLRYSCAAIVPAPEIQRYSTSPARPFYQMIEKNLSRLHVHNTLWFLALLIALSMLHPVFVLNFLPPDNAPDPFDQLGNAKYFVAVILAPLWETLFLQYLPARIVMRKRITGLARLAIMVLPFALAHVQGNDLVTSIVTGFTGGYLLGMCYLICSARSAQYAFAMTALVHGAHNLLVFVIA